MHYIFILSLLASWAIGAVLALNTSYRLESDKLWDMPEFIEKRAY